MTTLIAVLLAGYVVILILVLALLRAVPIVLALLRAVPTSDWSSPGPNGRASFIHLPLSPQPTGRDRSARDLAVRNQAGAAAANSMRATAWVLGAVVVTLAAWGYLAWLARIPEPWAIELKRSLYCWALVE